MIRRSLKFLSKERRGWNIGYLGILKLIGEL
jgi:hypothetical protein